MDCVGYVRVSMKSQGESGLGLEAQLEYIQRAAQQQGWNVVAVYSEAVSGTIHPLERPEFIKATSHGLPIIVAKLDRLSRDVEHIAGLMKRADFKVATMPQAQAFELHLYAALAQQEREFISNRTKEALASLQSRADAGDTVAIQKVNNRAQALAKGRAVADITAANNVRMNKVASYQDGIRPHLKACLHDKINTLQSVADCLNTKGLRTARGSEFTPTAVRRLMIALNESF
ncbi:recombinase family protein [Pseudomonas sp. R5(2019)]|uniref:recombinase family protein n=1 Tax=Pseudomonas sp. R5(2019) TaxID=2697566 RepID=UPI0014128F10|nr:recombinase family protein [Pseudomonas sp. R5(2019)]NBA96842.1 recombinase family protein [Pseudomonas sp. R5(2019)]